MGTWQVEQPPNARVVVTADWCGHSEQGALMFLDGPEGATVIVGMWAPGEWHSVHLVQEDKPPETSVPAETHACGQCKQQHKVHPSLPNLCSLCAQTCRRGVALRR